MSEGLRPCPWCGKEPLVIHFPAPHDIVQCIPCNRKSGNMSPEDWNTRPIEDALRADLARKDDLIAALEGLVEALDAWNNNYCGPRNPEWKKRRDALDSARAKLAEVRGE